MKKSKITITILGCIGIFLIAALAMVPAAQAGGKTLKFTAAAPFTKLDFVPVPDVKGHIIGVAERRGVSIYENGENATYHSRITFDVIKGDGSWKAYVDSSFADGSIIIWKCQGTVTSGKPRLLKGTGEYIKGTGRFEGIKGKLSVNGKYVTPYTKDTTKGDAVFDYTSTYTLPKK
jgi:hypothetical protein